MAIGNPAVVRAHTRVGRDGPVPPTPAYLEGQAHIAVQAVIAKILLDQTIKKALRRDMHTLTTTAGTTEYTLPGFIARVLNIRAGSDSEKLRAFDSLDDFDIWYSRRYGGTTVVDTDAPTAWYHSGRTAAQKIKITFSPAMGSETSMLIRYVRNFRPPYKVESIFPTIAHVVVLTGVFAMMTGGMNDAEFQSLKANLARDLDVTIGGNRKMRHGRRTRRVAARTRAMASGSSASWSSSTKWRR